jgi:hypothetical protein
MSNSSDSQVREFKIVLVTVSIPLFAFLILLAFESIDRSIPRELPPIKIEYKITGLRERHSGYVVSGLLRNLGPECPINGLNVALELMDCPNGAATVDSCPVVLRASSSPISLRVPPGEESAFEADFPLGDMPQIRGVLKWRGYVSNAHPEISGGCNFGRSFRFWDFWIN